MSNVRTHKRVYFRVGFDIHRDAPMSDVVRFVKFALDTPAVPLKGVHVVPMRSRIQVKGGMPKKRKQ